MELISPPWLRRLSQHMKPFLDGKVFALLFSITIVGVAVAQLWQLQRVVTASSVEGVSVTTFLVLAYNILIGALYGVKQCDSRLVLSVGIAFLAALSTAFVTWFRGGSF